LCVGVCVGGGVMGKETNFIAFFAPRGIFLYIYFQHRNGKYTIRLTPSCLYFASCSCVMNFPGCTWSHATVRSIWNDCSSIAKYNYQLNQDRWPDSMEIWTRSEQKLTLTHYTLQIRGAGIAQLVEQVATGWTAEVSQLKSPGRVKIFSSPFCPDQLWGPPNLSNGYLGLFPRG
jgi:hypothetical protein